MQYKILSKKESAISVEEICALREKNKWNTYADHYEQALKNSYNYYSVRDKNQTIAFARVISDGSMYALIVDILIDPSYQGQGLGTNMVNHIISDLKKQNIKFAHLIFDPKLESFYKSCGFTTRSAGTIMLN